MLRWTRGLSKCNFHSQRNAAGQVSDIHLQMLSFVGGTGPFYSLINKGSNTTPIICPGKYYVFLIEAGRLAIMCISWNSLHFKKYPLINTFCILQLTIVFHLFMVMNCITWCWSLLWQLLTLKIQHCGLQSDFETINKKYDV